MPPSSRVESQLPDQANLDYLKKQAKQLLKHARSDDPHALTRLRDQLQRPIEKDQVSQLKLSDAQLVIAREYGFASWPKLKETLERRQRIQTPGEVSDGTLLEVPLLPLRDYIVFPGMPMPLYVGRSQSLSAIEAAHDGKLIFLALQRDGAIDEPKSEDLFEVGTLAVVTRRIPSANGLQVIVRGERRARRLDTDFSGTHATAKVIPLDSDQGPESSRMQIEQARSIFLSVTRALYLPAELDAALESATGSVELTDVAAQHIPLALEKRQALLEVEQSDARLSRAIRAFDKLREEIERPQLDDFLGKYQLQPGFVVSFAKGEGSLIAETPWDRAEIFSRGGDAFAGRPNRVEEDDPSPVPLYVAMGRLRSTLSYKFQRDGQGRVCRLTRSDGYSSWSAGSKLGDREILAPAIRPTTAALRKLTGRYEIGEGFEAHVSLSGDQLNFNTHPLCPLDSTEFFGEREPVQLRFKFSEANEVLGMWVNTPSGRHQYWKVA